MHTALYIRFSSARQVQGASLRDQLTRLRADAAAAGETVVAEFIDQARSGTSAAKRPAYQAMLAAARRQEFQRIRVESVDRGHRNDTERRQFEQELTSLSISVVYVGEAEQQAPEYRKFQRGIKGLVAELESDATSQRTYKRHLHRARQGKWRGGGYPYGLQSDGQGWFEPDPETYHTLLWILERRAEGLGYHSIAKQLNQGLGETPTVPPTPGVLLYRKRPHLERQDPETGDPIYLPKRAPRATWKPLMIRRICECAVDGAYAGIYQWGKTFNRFAEDAEGQGKAAIRVDGRPPLVPADLLARVHAVEHAAAHGMPQMMAAHNAFLLGGLRCGACGQAMHGYTSTKQKQVAGQMKLFKYRKYRCAGRVNRPGSCQMPMLSADTIEQHVLEAIFARDYLPAQLRDRVSAALDRQRSTVVAALDILAQQLTTSVQARTDALAALADRATVSPLLRAAMIDHAEQLVAAHEALLSQQKILQSALILLDGQARSLDGILADPNLTPERWREPAVYQSLKRLFAVLVAGAELRAAEAGGGYVVALQVYRVPQSRENGTTESMLELFETTPIIPSRALAYVARNQQP